MSVITPKDCFHQPQVADLRLIACPGAEELTNLIDKHLVRWASEAGYQTNSFIIESACPRFQSGDASRCAATIFSSLLIPATTA